MSKSKKIPDRWESYSKMGKVIRGTTIMPIKVPLRESLTSSLPHEERFSPSMLLELCQQKGLKLGGVVDLTYTTKYYDGNFFSQNGVNYKKVFTAGHVIPDNKTYKQFESDIKELEKKGFITCVHCTHGLNRSGYMICRYMIEALNIEPQTAIRLFEEARGHKMERQNYIEDLRRRNPGVAEEKSYGDAGWNRYSAHRKDDTPWAGQQQPAARGDRMSGNRHWNDYYDNRWNQRQGNNSEGFGSERVENGYKRHGGQTFDRSCNAGERYGGGNFRRRDGYDGGEGFRGRGGYNGGEGFRDRGGYNGNRDGGLRGSQGGSGQMRWQRGEGQGSKWRDQGSYYQDGSSGDAIYGGNSRYSRRAGGQVGDQSSRGFAGANASRNERQHIFFDD